MATDTRDLLVKIKGDTKDFESAMHGVTKHSGEAGLSFGKLAGAVAAGQTIFNMAEKGIMALVGGIKSTVQSANDSENAISQLNTVLKSTNNAAGLSNTVLIQQANALQKVTTYSDEAVMSAQSLLLTFTNIKGNVFKDTIPIILDMSQALGQDLKSSAIQVGKALNDPIKGVTALQRVGVSFTAKQKEQIQTLVESGKTIEAQKLILKELNTEFGGSAEAAGKTFAGSMERLKNQVDDVKEGIGGLIIEAIIPITKKAADFVAAVNWDEVIARSSVALQSLGERLKEVYTQVFKVVDAIFSYLQPKFVALWHTIENMLPTFLRLYREVLIPVGKVIGEVVVTALGFAIDAFNAFLTVVTPVMNFLLDHKWILDGIAVAIGAIAATLAIGSAVESFKNGIAIAKDAVGTLRDAWTTVKDSIGWVKDAVLAAKDKAVEFGQVVRTTTASDVAAGASSMVASIATITVAAGGAIAAVGGINQALDILNAKNAVDKKQAEAIASLRKTQAAHPELKSQIDDQIKKLTGKASGGPITGGTPYVVGEKGPEIIVPNQSGTVIPNDKLGGGTVNITVNMGMYAGLPIEKRQIAMDLYKELLRAARAQGVNSLPIIGSVGVQ